MGGLKLDHGGNIHLREIIKRYKSGLFLSPPPPPPPSHPAKHLLQHTTGNIPLKKREREKPSAEPAACAIPVFSVPPSPHSRSSWREMGAKHMWATPPPSKGRLSTPSHRCGPSLGHLVAVGCRLSQRPPRAGSFLIFTSACLWAHF